MSASCKYTINAPDVVAENLGGEIVILNLANGYYFSLGGIACQIWSLLLAGHFASIDFQEYRSQTTGVGGRVVRIRRASNRAEPHMPMARGRYCSCRSDRRTLVGRWSDNRGLRRPCGADCRRSYPRCRRASRMAHAAADTVIRPGRRRTTARPEYATKISKPMRGTGSALRPHIRRTAFSGVTSGWQSST